MAKKKVPARQTSASVPADEFMEQLDHPLKGVAESLRAIVRDAHPDLAEGVKWNAPSYSIDGDDRMTFNLSAKDKVRIIFHRGAKVKDAHVRTRLVEDPAGLLEWAAADRAIATFRTDSDVASAKRNLIAIIKAWIDATREPV